MTGRVRQYGEGPYRLAVLHGGPGAAGSAASVARELGRDFGVLEPIQTALTAAGQIEELKAQLEAHAELPAVLIGHSWGAMLAYMFAGRYPRMVRKLILVGSGVFEEQYAEQIKDIRMSRVPPELREEAAELMSCLGSLTDENRDAVLSRLCEVMGRSDYYDPLPHEPDLEPLDFMPDVHARVWSDAKALRQSGEMLRMGRGIGCPLVIIHGDYDPHPVEGITEPLCKDEIPFRLIMLDKCGHEPWIERHARDEFFRLLRRELQ